MKDIKNFKNRTTKELTDTALKKIEKFKRFMPPLWYRLLTDFWSADAEPAALYHQND